MNPHSGNKALTIIIPAFNEEAHIASTLSEAHEAAIKYLDQFEIIVIDDGSSDNTFSVANAIAEKLGRTTIKVVRQERNQGVGAAFKMGLGLANYPSLTLIPGDNAFHQSGLETLFSAVSSADLIISYRENMEARTPLRLVLSRIATNLVRLVSGKYIRDAHSMYVFPVALTRSLNQSVAGYGYHLETLCRLLRKVDAYIEVPVTLNPKPDASSGVMKPKTLLILGATMAKLLLYRIVGKL